MKAIIITTKDGEKLEIDPVAVLTVDNTFSEYIFKGEDIESIEVVHA